MPEFSHPEPPLADFDTACTQMHDHDPADCAPETIAELEKDMNTTEPTTIDIPSEIVHTLAGTIGRSIGRPNDADVIIALIRSDAVTATADAYRFTVEGAHRLYCRADALTAYDLDETAEETYRHPAVVAEHAVFELLTKQAPEAYERLADEFMRAVDIEIRALAALETAGK